MKYHNRTFSSSTAVRTDNSSDLLSRIDRLLAKNKEFHEKHKEEYIKTKQEVDLEDRLKSFGSELLSRSEILKRSIRASQRTANINEEENNKLRENNSKLTKGQELINNELDKFANNENPSSIEVLKLHNLYNQQVLKQLEKAEAIVDAPVWRKIEEGSSNIDKTLFEGMKAKAKNQKEKFETYCKEELQELSKMEKEFKLNKSPMDFVEDKLETEMPSYTDPED